MQDESEKRMNRNADWSKLSVLFSTGAVLGIGLTVAWRYCMQFSHTLEVAGYALLIIVAIVVTVLKFINPEQLHKVNRIVHLAGPVLMVRDSLESPDATTFILKDEATGKKHPLLLKRCGPIGVPSEHCMAGRNVHCFDWLVVVARPAGRFVRVDQGMCQVLDASDTGRLLMVTRARIEHEPIAMIRRGGIS